MDIKDLKTLIKMVTDTDITEFEMENADEKIIIKRGKEQEILHVAAPQPYYHQTPPAPAAAAPAPPAAAAEPAAVAAPLEKGEIVTSPIVGTMYWAPSPDSDPYVTVGQIVEKGQVLCIVEAMKLMNEIEAEFKCKILEVVKANAEPVEFGEPLFRVERL
ncbi:acetyl-CoA carboxylase biotin carboxyl carrier protein [Desulfuromonas sp. TF]|uniref:acetyl-CoA carboxylase biotin carboxyl carrier protein n=1 Tax=Desulfuromonas sp. TF TaxID=1232410 RepID=UPI00041E64C8|nr:acetyl-CoA carboxylase biotin carboxyl carrier protein [Desulfuromonas sp. TF]